MVRTVTLEIDGDLSRTNVRQDLECKRDGVVWIVCYNVVISLNT